MINYADVTGEIKTKHKLNWPYIPDHPFRTIIIRSSGSGKTNTLLNPIKLKDGGDYYIIDKIYSNVNYPNEANY